MPPHARPSRHWSTIARRRVVRHRGPIWWCIASLISATLIGLTGGVAAAGSAGSAGPDAASVANSWTVYHGNPSGSGDATSVASVKTTSRAWTSPHLGQLYGEPLAYSGNVYVATENDVVYALSAATGAVVWSTHVATAVPSSSLPCGDISPTVGITGTPVIDPARNEIFVVADELVHKTPAHVMVGLSTATGAVEMTQPVDPPGADPAALLQRTGLNLDKGEVVFGMGGNDGDCAAYKGRVGAVSETGGTPLFFTVDAAPANREGAVWMGGAAPEVDSSGHIWVSSGNGSVTSSSQPYDDSDAALELSSSLQLVQFFAPSSWAQDNASDADMTMAPTLFSDGLVLLAGKSRIAYLLNGSHLGGIGGQLTTLSPACSNVIDGGSAVVGATAFIPCLSGPVALQVVASPPSITLRWSAGVGGGPPIVAAGLVWTIGQDGVLYGLNASTGAVVQRAGIGVPFNHFPTPSVGQGLLLAPAPARVIAFSTTPAP